MDWHEIEDLMNESLPPNGEDLQVVDMESQEVSNVLEEMQLPPGQFEGEDMMNESLTHGEGSQAVDMECQEESNLQNEESQILSGQFESREDLLNTVRDFVIMQGYATSIKKSKKDQFVIIGCDRGGSYRNRSSLLVENRKRKTASRLTNCPFEVRGRKKVNGPWTIEVVNGSHNHAPSTDMSGHPSCRRFSVEEISRIKEMSRSGISSRQILSSLRQTNPKLKAISKSVYNMKAKIRQGYLSGRTSIEALFDELGKGGFTYNLKHDLNGHVTHLFFAHPISMALARSYSNVFVMDCTYKTNKYKMPLLDIIGVSSFNTSFYSGFAFLKEEKESDYVWALEMFKFMLGVECQPSVIVSDMELALMNAITVVFPSTTNLLCVWHIEKNIGKNCKKYFEEGEDWPTFLSAWTSIIQSTSESKYDEAVQPFEMLYNEKQLALNYIRTTWLPFKEHFVSAWTNMHPHYGNHVTSRAEGAHALLKKYLQFSTGDLCEVKNKICLAIENQFQEIKAQLSSERVRVPHHFRIPLFKELITHVSIFALSKMFKQYEMMKSNAESATCTRHFMTSMGLPCAHMLKIFKNEVLNLDDIHSQWRLDIRSFEIEDVEAIQNSEEDQVKWLLEEFQHKYKEWPLHQKEGAKKQICQLVNAPRPLLNEPNVQSHRGRPSGSMKKKGTTSTRRDPSAFEMVENMRKCSVCKRSGHNSRTCQHKVKDNEDIVVYLNV